MSSSTTMLSTNRLPSFARVLSKDGKSLPGSPALSTASLASANSGEGSTSAAGTPLITSTTIKQEPSSHGGAPPPLIGRSTAPRKLAVESSKSDKSDSAKQASRSSSSSKDPRPSSQVGYGSHSRSYGRERDRDHDRDRDRERDRDRNGERDRDHDRARRKESSQRDRSRSDQPDRRRERREKPYDHEDFQSLSRLSQQSRDKNSPPQKSSSSSSRHSKDKPSPISSVATEGDVSPAASTRGSQSTGSTVSTTTKTPPLGAEDHGLGLQLKVSPGHHASHKIGKHLLPSEREEPRMETVLRSQTEIRTDLNSTSKMIELIHSMPPTVHEDLTSFSARRREAELQNRQARTSLENGQKRKHADDQIDGHDADRKRVKAESGSSRAIPEIYIRPSSSQPSRNDSARTTAMSGISSISAIAASASLAPSSVGGASRSGLSSISTPEPMEEAEVRSPRGKVWTSKTLVKVGLEWAEIAKTMKHKSDNILKTANARIEQIKQDARMEDQDPNSEGYRRQHAEANADRRKVALAFTDVCFLYAYSFWCKDEALKIERRQASQDGTDVLETTPTRWASLFGLIQYVVRMHQNHSDLPLIGLCKMLEANVLLQQWHVRMADMTRECDDLAEQLQTDDDGRPLDFRSVAAKMRETTNSMAKLLQEHHQRVLRLDHDARSLLNVPIIREQFPDTWKVIEKMGERMRQVRADLPPGGRIITCDPTDPLEKVLAEAHRLGYLIHPLDADPAHWEEFEWPIPEIAGLDSIPSLVCFARTILAEHASKNHFEFPLTSSTPPSSQQQQQHQQQSSHTLSASISNSSL